MCNDTMILLLSGHLDGTNTPKQEALITEHLTHCEECQRRLAQYQAMDATLSDLKCEPPASFTAGVMDAIAREPQEPKSKPKKTMRYGTMFAAVAAALVLVVSAGGISLSQKGVAGLLFEGCGSAAPEMIEKATAPEEPAAAPEATPEPAPTAEAEPESYDTAEYSALLDQESAFSYHNSTLDKTPQKDDSFPCNVDCAALANNERCLVGVLYGTQEDLPELADAPALPLSGGVRYTITAEQLTALAERFDALMLYEPKLLDVENPAYLILVTETP